jgi:hypothetical protein
LSAAWFEESKSGQSREKKVGAACIPKEQEEEGEGPDEEGEEGEERGKTNGGWRCCESGGEGGEVPSTTSAVLVLLVLLDLGGRHSIHRAETGLGLSNLFRGILFVVVVVLLLLLLVVL